MQNISFAKVTNPLIVEENLLLRKRLFHELDRARKKRVVWVSGLPGSGKTTLVASYLSANKVPHAWYHIDASDADLATFFYYLRYLVKGLTPSKRSRLPLLTPEYLGDITTYTRRYFETLYSMLPGQFVLAFDNYHEINSNPVFHTIIHAVLMNVPEHVNIIVISREPPPPALIRLRANSTMELIDNELIKFTPEEVQRLIHLRLGIDAAKETTKQLHSYTDGWAAGIVLMLEQNKQHEKLIAWEDLKNKQALFNYFSTEIFNRIQTKTRNFMLRTSFFHSMTVKMAAQMTGNNLSGEILNKLAESSYFTIRNQNDTYQYHDLFREFLLSMAKDIWPEEQFREIQHYAAKILEDAGYSEDATALFLQSQNLPDAVRVIMKHAKELISQGKYQTLGLWLKALPDHTMRNNPWLMYWQGACKLPINPGESNTLFKKAFKLFTKKSDRNGMLMAWTGAMDSVTFGFGSFKLYDPLIRIMEKLVKGKRFPVNEMEIIATMKMFFAMVFRQHFNPKIKKWLKRVLDLLKKNDTDVDFRIQVNTIVALYYLARGDISKGDSILSPLRKLAYSKHVSPLTFLTFKSIDVLYNWNTADHDYQFKSFYDGMNFAETTGIHVMDFTLSVFGAGWMLSTGHVQSAKQLLQKISGMIDRVGTYDRVLCYIVLAGEAMIREDFISAYNSQKKGMRLASDSGDINLMVLSALQISQILHELSEDKKALYYLKKAHTIGKGQKQFNYIYLIVKALFAFDRNDEPSGLRLLRQALQIGQTEGYVNFIGWRPSVMARLCVKALEHGISTEYVRSLIKKRNLVPDEPPLVCEDWPWAFRFYTLGSFRILKDDVPIEFSRKAQVKPLELLQYLIMNNGKAIEFDQIGAVLWPEAPGDYAHRTLDITLHRLRRLLGSNDAVLSEAGKLLLNQSTCWTDVKAFELAIKKLEIILSEQRADTGKEKVRTAADAVFNLYKGPFFSGSNIPLWSLQYKEILHAKFLRFIERAGMYFEGIRNVHSAILTYQTGLEIDNQVEVFYQRLMVIYKSLGRNSEVASTYRHCAGVLPEMLGVEPSEETKKIYQSIKP